MSGGVEEAEERDKYAVRFLPSQVADDKKYLHPRRLNRSEETWACRGDNAAQKINK